MIIDEIFEARKTKTDTKTSTVGIDNLLNPEQPSAKPVGKPKEEPKKQQAPNRPTASQADTLRATQGIANPRMADLLSRMRNIENDPEDTGYPTIEPETLPDVRVDTDNLPAVANQSLQAAGVQRPKWHKVANLPGNMSRGIRTLGKRLFHSFTNTPTDEITMIGNLGGMGPNTPLEVNSVAGWLRNHGKDLGGVGNIDFNNIIPGYNAEIAMYTAAGIRWMLVRDEFGSYIYSWPESESKTISGQGALGHDRPMLPR